MAAEGVEMAQHQLAVALLSGRGEHDGLLVNAFLLLGRFACFGVQG